MNLENVKSGTVFKNYKDMCEKIDEPIKKGNSKDYHLLDLERYFDYSKQGHKIIINSIRDVPLEKIPRGYNPYGDLIQILLLDLLAREGENATLHLSCTALLSSLSMVNTKYKYFRYNTNKLYNATKINKTHLTEWYDTTHSNLKHTLESTLNTLNKKALISWSYSVTFVFQNYEYRKAYDEEVSYLLECERTVLDELKCADKSDLFKKGQWELFSEKVNSMLYDEYGVLYYYKSYEIIYNRNMEFILDESKRLKHLLGEYERMEKQYELNNIIIHRLNENAEKRVEKVADIHEFELTEKQSMRKDDGYLNDNKALCDMLIKKKQ